MAKNKEKQAQTNEAKNSAKSKNSNRGKQSANKKVTQNKKNKNSLNSKPKKQTTQKLLLSHCGVLVMGENLTESQINEIYEFCFNERDITLSARVVVTENAKQLLQTKPVSSIAVGYDILGLIEQYSKKDKQIKNRYFEIMALEKQVALPKITPTKEGYYLENY